MKIGAFLSVVLLCLSIEVISLCVLLVWGAVGLWRFMEAAAAGGAFE